MNGPGTRHWGNPPPPWTNTYVCKQYLPVVLRTRAVKINYGAFAMVKTEINIDEGKLTNFTTADLNGAVPTWVNNGLLTITLSLSDLVKEPSYLAECSHFSSLFQQTSSSVLQSALLQFSRKEASAVTEKEKKRKNR